MNPLSDTIVALRPMTMTALPFKVPNSHRLIDPALPVGADSLDFFNFDPLTGNASNVTNLSVNYGWEYLWHCHILGHEENDMMRTIATAQPPEAPINVSATGNSNITVSWTDNSIISNWVTIQRDTVDTFNSTNLAVFNVAQPECTSQAGCSRSYVDTTAPANTSVYYRIMANNTVGAGDNKLDAPRNPDGSYSATLPAEVSSLTPGFIGYANVTANSEWSDTGSRLAIPIAEVTSSLTFNGQLVNTSSTNQRAVIKNIGTGNLLISSVTLASGANYAISSNTCPNSLTPGNSCSVNIVFTPTSIGILTDTLTITDNSSTGTTQLVSLSGTGIAPIASITSPAPPAGLSFGNRALNSNTTLTVNLANIGSDTLIINNISVSGIGFTKLAGGCGSALSAGSNCSVSIRFTPTAAGDYTGTLTFSDNSNGITASIQSVSLSGSGVAAMPIAEISNILSFGNIQVRSSSTLPVSLTNTGAAGTLVISSISVTGAGFSRVTGTGNCGANLAPGATCSIYVRFLPTIGGNATGNIAVTDNSGNIAGSIQNVSLTGTGTIVAVNDSATLVSSTALTQTSTINVRVNDGPSGTNAGVVSISGTPIINNNGATASVSVNASNNIVWTLTGSGTTGAARQASKRGTYIVNYLLTNGTATSTATVTLTVN
jgi:hypothetical protein